MVKTATTWADAIEQFGDFLREEEKKPRTIKAYADDLNRFAAWYHATHHEQPMPDRLDASELREWRASLEKEHKPRTTNVKLAALRRFLAWATWTGLGPPIRLPKSLSVEDLPPFWLTKPERKDLLRAVRKSGDVRGIAVIMVLIRTGLRVAELAAVVREKIDMSERKGSITTTGKGGKRRVVPLDQDARQALLDLFAAHPTLTRKGPIFHGIHGPLTVRGIQAIVAHYGRVAGLDSCTPHDLRHTCFRDMAERKVPLEVIAKIAGHTSIQTTLRYIQPGREDIQAAVNTVAGDD